MARRFLRLTISAFILVSATFFMVQLVPGNPVIATLGDQATPQLVAQRTHELGLDQPLLTQYAHYFQNLAKGDFGTSIITKNDVSSLLAVRLPNTLSLAIPAFLIALSISIFMGFSMALKTRGGRNERLRSGFVLTTGVLNSIPEFVLAVALSAVFAVWLGLLPVAGKGGPSSYVLPIAALVILPVGSLSRIARVEALKVLEADYILSARARDLPASHLYLRHILPNMMTATLTYAGVILSQLVAGTVLVENVFGWPGLGTAIADAVVQKDYPVIQGVLLVLGALVLLINMTVDVLLKVLDPQSRIGGG